jgi:hypothetical protein
MTIDAHGQPVVAHVHVGVGEYCIVRLPNGHLEARRRHEMELTARPFQPLSSDAFEALLRAKFPTFQIRRTERYLFVSNTSHTFTEHAVGLLDAMHAHLDSYLSKHRLTLTTPEHPLVVVMFSSVEEMRAFQRLVSGEVAFYDPRTNFVVLREPQGARGAAEELEMSQAWATIAHEGAHQILANIGVHQRLAVWPMWLAEGLAEYLAPANFTRRLRGRGPGSVNNWRMHEIEQYLAGRAAGRPAGELVKETVSASKLTSTGYATAWGLTHYLANQHKTAFSHYLRKCSEIRPLEGATQFLPPGICPQNLVEFREAFGDDLTELEKKLIHYLIRLPYDPPLAHHPHYLAQILIPAGRNKYERRAALFLTQEMAEKWQVEVLEQQRPGDQQATVQRSITEFPNRRTAEIRMNQFLSSQ